MKEDFKAIFVEEATDLISDLETSLLALEKNPDEKKLIEKIFRVMHTFKGNCAMFGFEEMGEFTHHLENIYDLIRDGKLKVTTDILNLTLESIDHLKNFLGDFDLTDEKTREDHQKLISLFLKVIKNDGKLGSETLPSDRSDSQKVEEKSIETTEKFEDDGISTYLIHFKPGRDLLKNGSNPLYLLDEVFLAGETMVVAQIHEVPSLEHLNPEDCYLGWDVVLATTLNEDQLHDIFIFVESLSDIRILKLGQGNILQEPKLRNKISQHLSLGKGVDIDELMKLFRNVAEKESVQTGTTTQDPVQKREQVVSSIRVSGEKLDLLMSLVSELVTTQASLSLFSEQQHIPELVTIAENVEKISRRLRDNTFSICLIPIENMLTRFKRLVRDLSGELGKDVEFKTEGADTELDKSIIDSLVDPIMHILRNSMDHGIEDNEKRKANGKPAKGTILFKAYYSGTNVIIQIKDDGAGIDPEKIRNKAIEKGLISAEQVMSRREILDLIFAPGFSTAEKVTEVSGRGVGMDVVKRKISDIRGEVEIDSEPGEGTSISIKLPLTLSIIDGLLVKVRETFFVIPLSAVNKCYEVKHERLTGKFNNLIVLDGQNLPYCYLREEFRMSKDAPEHEQIVVVHYDDKQVGLVVDVVIGEYQAVLKPLGKMYKNIDIVSGATILGDGTIALVLDTNKIIKQFSDNLTMEEVL